MIRKTDGNIKKQHISLLLFQQNQGGVGDEASPQRQVPISLLSIDQREQTIIEKGALSALKF